MSALSLSLVLILALTAEVATATAMDRELTSTSEVGGLGGGCSSCSDRATMRSVSLDNIKQEILSKLGFAAAPNISGRALPNVPPLRFLSEHEAMQSDQPANDFIPGEFLLEEADDYTATIEKVYAFAQPPPKFRHRKGLETLYFKFSDRVMGNKVIKAQLWLHLKTSEGGSNSVIISVRREGISSSSSSPPYVSVKEMRSRASEGKWISMDVRRFVIDWFKNPKDNVGLYVHTTISGQSEHPQRIIDLNTQSSDTSLVPFLEVEVADPRKHRTKRTIGLNCNEDMDEKRCCRYPLTVDFEEFGWDWIIAPKKYEAHYCSGDCPYVFLQKYPHTHLVTLASPSGSPGPCCAPRKFASISMLYFNEQANIIYGLLPGMVVERCGCS